MMAKRKAAKPRRRKRQTTLAALVERLEAPPVGKPAKLKSPEPLDIPLADDDDGIYPPAIRVIVTPQNLAALRPLINSPSLERSLLDVLNQAIAAKESGDPRIIREAENVCAMVQSVLRAIDSGDARGAARWALRLGAASDRLHVLPHEPDARKGKRAVKRANDMREKRTAKVQAEHEAIHDFVVEHRCKHPSNSLDQARKIAEKHFGVGRDKVFAATKDLSKKRSDSD